MWLALVVSSETPTHIGILRRKSVFTKMVYFVLLVLVIGFQSSLSRPELATDRYAAPFPEFLPSFENVKEFAPTSPTPVYGAPQPEYGPPPSSEYGPPATHKLITKNVYVHVPPPEEPEFQPVQVFEKPIPKKHYKIIFIKAPTPPSPTAPIIPEQIQDEHKTLVYVLVKKPDPQPQIEIPKVHPTEPSKPEVFFIKYKEGEKIPPEYGPPPPQYGPPH